MTKATPKKKTTVKAHRGFAHVPLRGRRRPPRRRPVGDPPIGELPRQLPRRRRRPPIQQPIGRPRRPMTPAERDAMTVTQGAMVFNSSTAKLQFYNGTSWIDATGVSIGLGMGVF